MVEKLSPSQEHLQLDPIHATWQELENAVVAIRQRDPWKEIWYLTKDQPITSDSIKRLVREGWKVVSMYTLEWREFQYEPWTTKELPPSQTLSFQGRKKIFINALAQGYTRDKVLAHELVHVCYPNHTLHTGCQVDGKTLEDSQHNHENYIITEWLARQIRANSSLLKHLVLSFGLVPQIYDGVSLEAFYSHLGFDKLPSSQLRANYFEQLKSKVLMD